MSDSGPGAPAGLAGAAPCRAGSPPRLARWRREAGCSGTRSPPRSAPCGRAQPGLRALVGRGRRRVSGQARGEHRLTASHAFASPRSARRAGGRRIWRGPPLRSWQGIWRGGQRVGASGPAAAGRRGETTGARMQRLGNPPTRRTQEASPARESWRESCVAAGPDKRGSRRDQSEVEERLALASCSAGRARSHGARSAASPAQGGEISSRNMYRTRSSSGLIPLRAQASNDRGEVRYGGSALCGSKFSKEMCSCASAAPSPAPAMVGRRGGRGQVEFYRVTHRACRTGSSTAAPATAARCGGRRMRRHSSSCGAVTARSAT